MNEHQGTGAEAPGRELGRAGDSVLQRIGRDVAPACASAITVLALVLLALRAIGPEALGLEAFRIGLLNGLVVALVAIAGAGLWLLVERKPGWPARTAASLAALLVLGVAAVRLLILSGHLAAEVLAEATAAVPLARPLLPMLLAMPPDAAVCLALTALGLLSMDLAPSWRYPPEQLIALGMGVLALASFVARAYGLLVEVDLGSITLMALPGSGAFVVLALGLLYARPRRGFAHLILSDTAGGESARWLLPVAVLVPVLMGALLLEGERRGLVTSGTGMVLLVMALVLLLLAMIWWNSAMLHTAGLQRESIRRRLHHESRHDALTGLANRLNFLQRLAVEAGRARQHQVPCALLYMDLDGFKQVNDTLGHPAGDDLLKVVAGRLKNCIRAGGDLCARLGGDEFVVILEDSPRARAYEVAERILATVSAPIVLDGHDVKVGVSIGVAFGTAQTESAETLLKAADVALYAAKHGGKGRVHPPAEATAAPASGK